MKNVHLVITDLFLPKDFAACVDLRLPALEKMLARGVEVRGDNLPGDFTQIMTDGQNATLSLEALMCKLFDVQCQSGAQIAPISAAFDGLGEGCWMRADPVHLRLQRDQLLLLPDVGASADEAGQLCAALNEYFAGQGMEFFAPHPQRWYMRADNLPDIETVPLSQAAGHNVRGLLPGGKEATRWHGVFNEIQMLLFAHPVNEAREARGELTVNSLWLWGGGSGVNPIPQKTCNNVSSDEVLAEMFAASAGIPFSVWPKQWRDFRKESEVLSEGRQLLIWTALCSALQRGDLDAWRTALLDFETGFAQPLWQALRSGEIAQLQVDILGRDCVRHLLLTRFDAWAFWRNTRPLAHYSVV